jgi:putative flippase GtrA
VGLAASGPVVPLGRGQDPIGWPIIAAPVATMAPHARPNVRDRLDSRFLRFLLVGGFAALINLLVGIVLRQWLGFTAAAILAYAAGMAAAFALNRVLVFAGAPGALHVQAAWFVLVNLAGIAQTVLIGLLLARVVLPWLGMDWHVETVAHAVGIAVPVVTSYLGHKHLSFRGAR